MSLSKDASVPCTQIFRDHALYVRLPTKGICCKCCTPAQGCTPIAQDWLLDFDYVG
jgi:hypothetical protein